MPLPNTGMTFTPFDPLPASDLNDLVENIEALADGTAFDSSTSTATFGGAWTSWTPTFASGSLGTSATVSGKHKQIGKTAFFKITGVVGSGSWTMSLVLTLPITAVYPNVLPIGNAYFTDTGTANYNGTVILASSTTATFHIFVSGTNGRADQSSNSNPHAWGAGDVISAYGIYEAA